MHEGASRDRERGRPVGRSVASFDPGFEPLLAVVRGRAVESVHRGAVAVAGVDGTLLGGVGDPLVAILLRSAAKPFQAAVIIQSGAADAFGVTDAEIAVMTASHAGAPEHVHSVSRLLERAGAPATAMVCGPAEHMCSGKHAGMLLLARHLGVAGEGYQREDHPVQQEIAAYLRHLLANCPPVCTAPDDPLRVFAGRDGCGVPVISTTLHQAAWLYAALAAGETPALARVRDAMVAHPSLVAGEDRFDTRLMRAAAGALVAKAGAEGVQGLGVMAAAVGCVVKTEDGSARPIPPLVSSLLRVWGRSDVAGALEQAYPSGIVDSTGQEAGRLELLVEEKRLRPEGSAAAPDAGPSGPGLKAGKGDRLTVCRGDEKDVLRFLRDQWPTVDEENFGRRVEWTADPYALVLRRDKKIAAVLKGHFIGGLASVDELMVARGSRGIGVGSLLLGRFEDEARRQRCARIVLRAVKDSPAEHFYRKRGYHRECVQYDYEFGCDYVRLVCDVEKAPGKRNGRDGEGTG